MLVGLILFAVATIAGFVDAIAGGGGLLTLPALVLAGLPPHQALGTNKGQSVFGSGAALLRYAHSPLLDRPRAAWTAPAALLGAAAGAALTWLISPELLKPLIILFLAGAAVFTLAYRVPATAQPATARPPLWAAAVGLLIGCYDGFFGPGTGTFLIVAYACFWRDRLDAASANAKVANFCSNLASLAMFAVLGMIRWQYALPMAAGQFIGGTLGAHATIRAGAGLVRLVVVIVSLALLARLAWGLMATP